MKQMEEVKTEIKPIKPVKSTSDESANIGKEMKNDVQPKKLTYEQLENVARQLSDQAKQLYAKLQETNMVNLFKRLDYLFKVIENAPSFNEDFVVRCTEEIESMITVPESDDSENDKKEEQ